MCLQCCGFGGAVPVMVFFQGSGVSDVLQRGGFSDVVAVTWFQWSGFGDDFSVEWCR